MFVTVEPGAERRPGIVEMEGQDAPAAHRGLALGHRARVSGLGAQIVARGEQMAGVDADANPLGARRAADQRRQLAEGPSDGVAPARRVLQRDLDAVAGGPRKRLVEGADDPANPGLEPRAQ